MPANNTPALNRVYANKKRGTNEPTLEGIYLSTAQLHILASKLDAMPNGPDGVCFMIGRREGSTEKTVEIIPYVHQQNTNKFYKEGGVAGKIHVDVGPPEPNSIFHFIIDSNLSVSQPVGQVAVAFAGLTTPGQKTPPPFPE